MTTPGYMDWEGLPEVLGVLDAMGEYKTRQRIEKKAVGKAIQPMAKAAKAAAPRSTPATPHAPKLQDGLYKKSIGWAVKYSKKQGYWVGIGGARTGFKTLIGHRKSGKPVYQDPVKYGHLIELGAPAIGVPAHPHLRPAFDSGLTTAQKTMSDVVYEELAKEASKTGRRRR